MARASSTARLRAEVLEIAAIHDPVDQTFSGLRTSPGGEMSGKRAELCAAVLRRTSSPGPFSWPLPLRITVVADQQMEIIGVVEDRAVARRIAVACPWRRRAGSGRWSASNQGSSRVVTMRCPVETDAPFSSIKGSQLHLVSVSGRPQGEKRAIQAADAGKTRRRAGGCRDAFDEHVFPRLLDQRGAVGPAELGRETAACRGRSVRRRPASGSRLRSALRGNRASR